MLDLPDVAQPKRVAAAARVLAERETDVEAAERALREARAGIDAAKAEDRAAFAAERDAGRPDPGPKHAEEARARLDNAGRVLEGEQLRHDRAREALDQAVSESLAAWTAAVEKQVRVSEARTLELVAELEQAEQRRNGERAALDWLSAYRDKRTLPRSFSNPSVASTLRRNRNDPSCYTVAELLEAMRAGVAASTLDAAVERAAEREREELADEQARAELRRVREMMGG